MDNRSTHFVQANQPLGQETFLSSASPSYQFLGSPVNDQLQQHTNLSPLWLSLEQQRLQLDQILQVHNAILLNLMESIPSDALMQKNVEIARLRKEMQQMQEILSATVHDREEWKQLAFEAYEINQSLINQSLIFLQSRLHETHSHASSNELDVARSGQAPNMERAVGEKPQSSLKCKLCSSGVASVLILPCQHLCACKSCGVQLMTCPMCNAAKVDAIEARFS